MRTSHPRFHVLLTTTIHHNALLTKDAEILLIVNLSWLNETQHIELCLWVLCLDALCSLNIIIHTLVMQNTTDVVEHYRFALLAVTTCWIWLQRIAVCIHTTARDEFIVTLHHTLIDSNLHVRCILEHHASRLLISQLKQPHDESLLNAALVHHRTQSCQVVNYRNTHPVSRNAGIHVWLSSICQHHSWTVLLEEFAVMHQQSEVLHWVRTSAVNIRIIIDIRNILHQFKLRSIRTRNQHLIAIRYQSLNQLFTEAIDVIIIVCQQCNNWFSHNFYLMYLLF